ncbi:MAG: zinc ribbon domain-containing protein, partial [Proteobacteria bacterium]|nr:zinc ribbon domain-containing protein [Pseudomonadota bacterium]
MMRCVKCDHELPESSRFCGYCGNRLDAMPNAQVTASETLCGIALSTDELKKELAIMNHETDEEKKSV